MSVASQGFVMPSTSPMPGGLGTRVRRGVVWSVFSVGSTVALQLGFGAVMARLLEPAAFGLVAMGLVALRLFSYLSQIGLSMTLGAVQRPVMSERDLRIALGVVWTSSTVSIGATLLLAPLAGGFFAQPAMVPLLQVLAINLLLQSLGNVSLNLLRRQLRFKALALVEVLSYTLGYGALGIAVARAGGGAWSLVAANLGQSMLAFAMAYAFTRHPLRPVWAQADASHWRYGLRHTAISFTEFVSANADAALIGRLIGEAGLGLYNRAQLLVYQPVDKAAGILTRVLFPLVAQIQHQSARVGALFLLGIGLIGVFAGAVALAVCAAAPEVVAVLLGPQWTRAVPVVRLLALVVPVVFMSNIAGVVCDAMNLLSFKLRLQVAGMLAVTALMAGMSPWGVEGIVFGLLAGEVLRFAAYFLLLGAHLAYRRRDGLQALGAVLAAQVMAFGGVAGTLALVQGWPLGLRLFAAAAAGALALLVSLVLLVKLLDPTASGELARQQLPGWRAVARRLGGAEAPSSDGGPR